jgi:hypothetical protein
MREVDRQPEGVMEFSDLGTARLGEAESPGQRRLEVA